MEGSIPKALAFCWALLFSIFFIIVKLLCNLGWKPKSLEKQLKQGGIRGTSYKLLYEDKMVIYEEVDSSTGQPLPSSNGPNSSIFFFLYHLSFVINMFNSQASHSWWMLPFTHARKNLDSPYCILTKQLVVGFEIDSGFIGPMWSLDKKSKQSYWKLALVAVD